MPTKDCPCGQIGCRTSGPGAGTSSDAKPRAGVLSPGRSDVLESNQAMSLLTIMEIVGPVLLLAILIYGTLQWSRRRRGPTQAVREASTRQLYREGDQAEKREEGMVPGTPSTGPPHQR